MKITMYVFCCSDCGTYYGASKSDTDKDEIVFCTVCQCIAEPKDALATRELEIPDRGMQV